ncbi:MAG: hypothetical protein ACRDT6_29325, partial [Micromonosporaceae bacterium]
MPGCRSGLVVALVVVLGAAWPGGVRPGDADPLGTATAVLEVGSPHGSAVPGTVPSGPVWPGSVSPGAQAGPTRPSGDDGAGAGRVAPGWETSVGGAGAVAAA